MQDYNSCVTLNIQEAEKLPLCHSFIPQNTISLRENEHSTILFTRRMEMVLSFFLDLFDNEKTKNIF